MRVWTVSEILTIVSALSSALAAIAAFITCFLHYKGMKPKIKILKVKNQEAYFYYNDSKNFCCAALGFEFVNSSNICGTISYAYIIYNKNHYEADCVHSNYEIKNQYSFTDPYGSETSLDELRMQFPLKLEGYTYKEGIIFVPGLPKISEKSITVKLKYKITGQRHLKTIRKIILNYEVD